jgi:FAD/FMN-containing dehydrogenase
MQPNIRHSEVKQVTRWTNFHGTVEAGVQTFCTPDVMAAAGDDAPRRMARHGQALQDLLAHCFANDLSLRTLGSAWSLSRIIEPRQVVLDPAYMNVVLRVNPAWVTPAYAGKPLVFAQGGATISSLNRRLGQAGLALQTSGASDGHRIAGCVATGTHGSALGIGAVHDTLRALHLVIAPDQAVLVQPTNAACGDELAAWLARETGIPTESVCDDERFHAYLVTLGSLGVVHGVVLEVAPLYKLRRRKLRYRFDDAALWRAVQTLDTSALGQPRPYHFEVVLQPYPETGKDSAYAVLMWKEPHDGGPFAGPTPAQPGQSNEVLDLIGQLSESLDGPLGALALKALIRKTVSDRYQPGDSAPRFPGQMFGWSTTPPGQGASTELVVDHTRTRDAVDAIYHVLAAADTRGEHLLGAVALRFVPRTHALLGMNIHAFNTFIELPSIRTPEVARLYRACYAELQARGIPFTCHWGQQHELDAAQVAHYFGDRAARWRAARRALLGELGQRVFASADLASLGLS